MVLGKLDRSRQKNENGLLAKINPEWTKDLNMRPETVKLLEENLGKKILAIRVGDRFWGEAPKGKATESETSAWDSATRSRSTWTHTEPLGGKRPTDQREVLANPCLMRS